MLETLKAYKESLILLGALLAGAVFGVFAPEYAIQLKPLGSIFLNLLFMVIVPLVSISVMSSIANMTDMKKLGKILGLVFLVSVSMAIIPSAFVVGLAQFFDPAAGVTLELAKEFKAGDGGMDFVSMITTNDFVGLLSKSNILPLVIMSVLGGIAIGQAGEKGQLIARALESANVVVMNIVGLIMKLAPIGLGAFFAATMASQDTAVMGTFASTILLYTVAVFAYFVIFSCVYSYIGGGVQGVKAFWKNCAPPTITSLATCSSLGTLPITIAAAKKTCKDSKLVDICMPLFVNLNKGGVASITALKIAFAYAVLGLPFTFEVFMITMLLAVIAAIIIGGVPGGAFLGEIFIVTTLGLPMEIIPMLVVIGAVTDAFATMLNVVHDINATQIVERFMGKKQTT